MNNKRNEMTLEEWEMIEKEDPILQEIDKSEVNHNIKEIPYSHEIIDYICEQKGIKENGSTWISVDKFELKTKKQKQIYKMLRKGLLQKEIAEILEVTPQAISKIVCKMYNNK